MDPNTQQVHLDEVFKERLSKLPKVIQDAITSANVQKRLRALADTHKLHLDQWQKLENEVMLALLGFEHIEDLQKNIETEVGVTSDVARSLAESMNGQIFEPIRQELERGLAHPEAKVEQVSAAETARQQILSVAEREEQQNEQPPAGSQQLAANAESRSASGYKLQAPGLSLPATPPPPPPQVKVARPSQSTEYRPGEISATRTSIVDDPYREPPQ